MCVLYLFTKTVSNALLYIFETGCGSRSYVLASYVHECNNVLYMRLYASVGLSPLFALKKKLHQLVSQTQRISGEENTAVFCFVFE